jgi:hypothetical protein
MAIELDPEFAYAWYKKGQAFQLLKRDAEAKLAFDKASELGGVALWF